MASFIWDDANRAHAQRHGVCVEDIEYVVRHAKAPWPMAQGDHKFIAWGRTEAGEYIQVVYVLESDAINIDYSEVDLLELESEADGVYVIHAMPLADDQKRNFRKLNRRKGKR
jgi:uncharacterized DUF497 family protein